MLQEVKSGYRETSVLVWHHLSGQSPVLKFRKQEERLESYLHRVAEERNITLIIYCR